MATIRQAKVGEMIKRELAEILLREIRDPRLAMVSINAVEVAKDFTVAKVFVSVMGTDTEKLKAMRAVRGAAGMLRGYLGKAIDLRTVPTLLFEYDEGVERGVRMFELLKEEEKAMAELHALSEQHLQNQAEVSERSAEASGDPGDAEKPSGGELDG